MLDLEAAIQQGKHKSATENVHHVRNLLGKDVMHGFAMPLTLDAVQQLPNAQVQPIGVVKQRSLNESGARKEKRCLNHDPPLLPLGLAAHLSTTASTWISMKT